MDQGDHNAHRTSRCARNGASGRPRPTGSSSSTPVCAPGHLPPGRGKAGRAARCAAPTACTEAVPPFFVGAGHWPAHRCTRRVQEAAPLQGAETPTGDRKGCPYGVSSTSTVGSVKPGAEFESHRMQFWGSQAPVGREETQAATQILRAGTFTELLRRGPRSGGLGESRHWRTEFASAASLSVFWFLFHVEKELAPQGETL